MTSHFINPTLVQCRIPLVPILGETYQLEMATGEKLYIEQICHHPSITAFLLEGDGFTYSGSYQINAALNGPNSVKGWKEGKQTIKFANDGAKISIVDPMLIVSGLLAG
jgi:hypothetical protein